MAREIDGFARGGTDQVADNHEGDKGKDGAGGDFDDKHREFGLASGRFGGAGGL